MKALVSFTLAVLGASALAQIDPYADNGYTREEVEALSIVIQQRLEREDPEAALMMVQRFIADHSGSAYRLQTNGHKKHRLIQSLVASRVWRFTDEKTQAEILRLALINGPLTPMYERELLYLLAGTQSLEGIATILDYAIQLSVSRAQYLPNQVYPQIVSDWLHVWRRLSRGVGSARNRLLADTEPVHKDAIVAIILSWLNRFRSPDEIIALVNARTSVETLRALAVLIDMRRDWPQAISPLQANRLNFWRKSRGCEDSLTIGSTGQSN